MSCPACGRENRPGRRFCVECGTPLAASCPTCGAAIEADERFCGECGTALRSDTPAPVAAPAPADAADPPAGAGAAAGTPSSSGQAERRLVSILFADLVGFTALSEGRDAEETRELLTGYYDTCRQTIARYGGAVEKFIGDAVMAVWGTPTAHEDDAERAVRAALELVADVPSLAPGGAELQARAAVLTGEAAVTIGAEGQGMVAGDLVNTAARLQAAAPAGEVLVGEGTRRATSASIVFEAVPDQALRGKTAPVAAWRAIRVVSGRGGYGRSDRLESPFVGRDEELRLLKDLFHATARERRARLVSVVGLAGIGKSRLAWEFEKYIDGLVETVYWHHGRSPAYGESITFWALSEMVRGRAGIAETDDPETTATKLGEMLRDYVPDDADRRWIEPRIRGLLGLQELPTGEREELFAAWRRLFEHISTRGPVVMVFGDLHWADAGQIDLIEHILDASRGYPIFVMTLARPEIFDRRPDWGAGQRNFTSLRLDPLPDEAMRQLLAGIAPGLPGSTAQRMVERAEGIPLYAVETVRMLMDEGILVPDDDAGSRLARDVATLAVPESLQALIAARLDALAAEERSLLQHGAVLGQSFTVEALAAITGRAEAELESSLRGLVRRELLVLDADPRSAERGQYRFLQALVKEVAYSTLARRDRRARHLAAARYFESLGDEELAGALANHYLAAYQAAGDSPGSDALAAQARIALRAAADRATALHSNEQALAFFERAIEITPAGVEQAALRQQAANAAQSAGRFDLGDIHLRLALEQYQAAGDAKGIADATAWLGVARLVQSDVEGAVTMLESALAQMADRKQTPEYTIVAAELARAYAFQSNYAASLAQAEQALVTAGRLRLAERVVELLITKAWALAGSGRWYEHSATLRGALAMAERLGILDSELRARNNLADVVQFDDPREALEIARIAIERAERVGWSSWSSTLVGEVGFAAIATGEWDWLRDTVDEYYSDELPVMMRADLDGSRAILSAVAGDTDAAEQHAARLRSLLATGASDQDRLGAGLTAAQISLYGGDVATAREQALGVLEVGIDSGEPDQVLLLVARIALWQRDAAELRRAYEGLAAARPSRLIDAIRRQMEAALAAHEGRSGDARQAARESIEAFRTLDATFELALAQMGVVAIFGGTSDEGRAAAAEARETLTGLGANAVLARLDDLIAAWPDPWGPPVGSRTTSLTGEPVVRGMTEGS